MISPAVPGAAVSRVLSRSAHHTLAAVARASFLWIALGLGGLAWIAESLLEGALLDERSFMATLLNPDAHELVMHTTALGSLLALALLARQTLRHRARIEEALRHEARQREALAEIGRVMGLSLDIDEVYGQVAGQIATLIPFDRIVITTVDLEQDTRTDAYVAGADLPGWEAGGTGRLSGSATDDIVRKRASLLLDARESERLAKRFPAQAAGLAAGLMSMIAVPLVFENSVIGTLNLRSRDPNAYSERDLALAEQVGVEIAGAIANARLHRQALQESHEREVLAEIGRVVSSCTDIGDVFEAFSGLVRQLLPFDRLSLQVVDARTGHGETRYTAGMDIPLPRGGATPAGKRVIGSRSALLLSEDTATGLEARFPEIAPLRAHGLRSAMAVPLIAEDRGVGVLHVGSRAADAYGEGELALLKRIAFQVAGAVGVARMRAVALKAQDELRASEAKYRSIFDHSNDAIFVIDPGRDRIVDASPRAASMLGYSQEELRSLPFSAIHPDEMEQLEAFARSVLDTGAGWTDRLTCTTKAGHVLPAEISAGSMDLGESRYVVALIRDISERKRTEEALHVHVAAMESAGDAVVVGDRDGKITLVNPAAERMFGVAAAELVGRPITELMPEEYRESHTAHYREAASGGGNVQVDRVVELAAMRADGSRFPVELSLSRVENAANAEFVAMIRDVTERRRAEEALRIRSAVIEAAAEMVVITTGEGVIEYVNDAFCRETGYSKEEAIGATPRILKSPRQDSALYSDLWATILAGRVWSGTLVNRRKDGSEYPEEMTVTPVPGANGENSRFIAIKRNITDRVVAEQGREARAKLDAENRELQRVNEARSQFLSAVSHELKTPLTSMLAFTDILSRNRGANLTDRQLQQLGVMGRSGRRLATLIDDLLDVSRIDGGRLKLQYSDFDARETLKEVAQSFNPILREREQSLSTVLPEESFRLRADRDRITQVVTNLLSNASKYSPDGARIELNVRRAGESLAVSVSDRGIGVSKEDQAKLFTPFFRAADKETRARPGTGLGLVIVKSIVDLHHGKLDFQSEPGVGTTVVVTVPGVLDSASASGSGGSAAPSPHAALRERARRARRHFALEPSAAGRPQRAAEVISRRSG